MGAIRASAAIIIPFSLLLMPPKMNAQVRDNMPQKLKDATMAGQLPLSEKATNEQKRSSYEIVQKDGRQEVRVNGFAIATAPAGMSIGVCTPQTADKATEATAAPKGTRFYKAASDKAATNSTNTVGLVIKNADAHFAENSYVYVMTDGQYTETDSFGTPNTVQLFKDGKLVFKQGSSGIADSALVYQCDFSALPASLGIDAKFLKVSVYYFDGITDTIANSVGETALKIMKEKYNDSIPYMQFLFNASANTNKYMVTTYVYLDSSGNYTPNGPFSPVMELLGLPDPDIYPSSSGNAKELTMDGGVPTYAWYWNDKQNYKVMNRGVSMGAFNPLTPAIEVQDTIPNACPYYSASTLDFGKVKAGQTKTDSVVVTNKGTDTLTVSSVTCDDPEFRASLSKMKLASGESAKLEVTFAPTDTNSHLGRITITHNGYDSPDSTLAVSGDGTLTSVQQQSWQVPKDFELSPNYPNPFNPSTSIVFWVKKSAHVRIAVFDLLGREVGVLVDEKKGPGQYKATFNAGSLASGTYLYRMEADGNVVDTRKMLLLK